MKQLENQFVSTKRAENAHFARSPNLHYTAPRPELFLSAAVTRSVTYVPRCHRLARPGRKFYFRRVPGCTRVGFKIRLLVIFRKEAAV